MMDCSSCFVFSAVVMLFLVAFSDGFRVRLFENEVSGKEFISWDDMKVDEHIMFNSLRVDGNQSRVIVVDQNGGGDSATVQGAIDMVPENNQQRVKIFILPGLYREKVIIPENKPYISFIGNHSQMANTIISWDDKAADTDCNGDPLGTKRSASVTIESDYFCATEITFVNTVVAVPGELGQQAVSLRLAGDKAMLYKVKVVGWQDTLFDESGTHFFFQCHIQGAVDFICGNGKSLYQDCVLESTAKKSGAVAAHHRDFPDENTGFSFVNCIVIGTGEVFLGRAWGNYSRVIYSRCFFDNIITPKGWSDWNYPERQNTVIFGEFQCSGPGADTSNRVPWSKKLLYEEAKPFLDLNYIDGAQWLRL